MFLGVRQQFRGQKSVAALAAQLGGCLAGGCLAASRATRWLLGSRAERFENQERHTCIEASKHRGKYEIRSRGTNLRLICYYSTALLLLESEMEMRKALAGQNNSFHRIAKQKSVVSRLSIK
ncbi:hypothetical protein BHE74_00010511 [Ensete ventricosum]|nr:hypothetical protein BHE74_00010511 [Ensete ventricosum]